METTTDLEGVDPFEALAEVDELHCQAARTDPAAFCSYVLQNDETGGPIELAPMHDEWHRLISAHPRLLIWSHTEAGKTVQLVGRVLYELGRNPNLRCVICSNTDKQAQKICISLRGYIEKSSRLHKVFPHLKRDRKNPWTTHELYLERKGNSKDPSIQTCGKHGAILGARIDLLILDDFLSHEVAYSPTAREDLTRWYGTTLRGRLVEDARVVCVGNAWHVADFMHQMAKSRAWKCYKYPVHNQAGRSNWPTRWSDERIAKERDACIDEFGEAEWKRSMLCQARSDEDSKFALSWITKCKARGCGMGEIPFLKVVPDGYRVYTGVDLSTGSNPRKKSSHLTAMFTIIVHPDESREVLCVESGKWQGPEIIERIKDVHRRFGGIVIVENNAAQEYIRQFVVADTDVPILPYTTGKNVFRDPKFGIESLGVEMSNGKWIIPCDANMRANDEIEAWVGDLFTYDPNAHPGDRLMASWFAREAAKGLKKKKVKRGRVDTVSR